MRCMLATFSLYAIIYLQREKKEVEVANIRNMEAVEIIASLLQVGRLCCSVCGFIAMHNCSMFF